MLKAIAATQPSNRIGDVLALIAGALMPLAFAPLGWFPIAMVAPALLFLLWRNASGARAAWRGFLFGFGLFGVGVSWVYVSLHNHGNMPAPMAGLAVVLFAAGLALFPAAVGGLQARFAAAPVGLRLALIVPALWVLFEWIRGWFLTGFPWLNLGYSHVDTPLAGWAPWLGVYGVSFAVAVSAGLLAAAWADPAWRWRLHVPVLVCAWLVGWLAGQPGWVQPIGEPLRVALVQANVPLAIKWRPEFRQSIVDSYVELSARASDVDLVVWPEAAVPGYFDQIAPQLTPRLQRLRGDASTDFLIGAIERDANASSYYNSVFAFGGSGGSYRKQHLVPFGEFLPLPGVLQWLLDYLHIPMSNFSRGGADQTLLRAAGHAIGVSVCYEDAFGEEVIGALPQATLLVNVSEDSWFGNSLAPHQRLQMARMRALEAGRPMLRAANTGPSVIIDHRGAVQQRSPQFAAYTLVGEVQPTEGVTPYVRFGNTPIVTALLVLLVGFGTAFRTRRIPLTRLGH